MEQFINILIGLIVVVGIVVCVVNGRK